MKHTPTPQHLISFVSLAMGLLMVLSFSACATRMNFAVSPVVPAAKGHVKVEKSKNGNYILTVETINLAPPERLSPKRSVYVVWMETKGNPVRNIGMIKSISSFFSNSLTGEMKASSTVKPTGVFITGEKDGDVSYPGKPMVLRTR